MKLLETLIAIDPGASGGFANFDVATGKCDDVASFSDWPDSVAALKATTSRSVAAVIESVHASPIMSRSSAFAFGMNFGGWIAICAALGIPLYEVRPQVWQHKIGIKEGLQGPQRKRELKLLCQHYFPGQAGVTLSTCDALLLGRFAISSYKKNGLFPGSLVGPEALVSPQG